jgi:hypothetical protein
MHITTSEAPRWGDFKALQNRFPGAWGRTRAYALLNEGKLRAKRVGGRTLWDFASADELIAGSPDAGKGAA